MLPYLFLNSYFLCPSHFFLSLRFLYVSFPPFSFFSFVFFASYSLFLRSLFYFSPCVQFLLPPFSTSPSIPVSSTFLSLRFLFPFLPLPPFPLPIHTPNLSSLPPLPCNVLACNKSIQRLIREVLKAPFQRVLFFTSQLLEGDILNSRGWVMCLLGRLWARFHYFVLFLVCDYFLLVWFGIFLVFF